MSIKVHHRPKQSGAVWSLHAWQLAWDGNAVWDIAGSPNGNHVDFDFPDVPDVRKLQFKYRATVPATNATTWEPEDFVRQLTQTGVSEVWTFEDSPRILYREPSPPGVIFSAGDELTVKIITKQEFRGGRLYAWNPYDPANPSAYFPESERDDAATVSTFYVPLASWMTGGFHLKLMTRDASGNESWEPDAANRVWCRADGISLWLKSGQCDVRAEPLQLSKLVLEVLMPASISAPSLILRDLVEQESFCLQPTGTRSYSGSSLFQVATYSPAIYAQAAYQVYADADEGGGDSERIRRPFPANPADLTEPSRFVLGASSWLKTFPTVAPSVTLAVQPRKQSGFGNGLGIEVATGNSPPYLTAAATQGADGTWSAQLPVAQNTTTRIRLVAAAGEERKPYERPRDWINTGRFFTPPATNTTFYTTEAVFGVTSRGKTAFAEPPSRQKLMEAAFGPSIVKAGIFDSREMPHGATQVGSDVYFILHAPHTVWAALVLVNEHTPGPATREEVQMTLTPDVRYWWCAVPAKLAPPGTRYHFVLNDDMEVLDPASREVLDSERGFRVKYGCDPNDSTVSWSVVLDVTRIAAQAHASPWNTMGWEMLLIYELHARRFTDLQASGMRALDLLADELKPNNRLGREGYLRRLPVTAIELMPVNEMSAALSWGYDTSFYFSIDSHYGGAAGLANFANEAHANGKAVMLDVVFNHSLGSPLMEIASDVYRNGDYCGDRMNCGHPMVVEFLRQAAIYTWRTFGLDGFRFDDTKQIATNCVGGWDFLRNIRFSLHRAAEADGRRWPFCVAENEATRSFDVAAPVGGVMDSQWDKDEVFRIRDASYDMWTGDDDAGPLRDEMNKPHELHRPFFEAVRHAETHDLVSGQDEKNKRIAARPPFGFGLRMAKAFGALTVLSKGVPMLFMGQECAETTPFSFDSAARALNPQNYDRPPGTGNGNTKVLDWFRQLMRLRDDGSRGLQGDDNDQVVRIGHRTIAFTCGKDQSLFAVVTFGTRDQRQDSSWLGLPGGTYREMLNSSFSQFQVEFEPQMANGGSTARITSGQILNLPQVGALVLQRQ